MASTTKKVVEEVSGWLRVFEDGTVDRTWSGPARLEFLVKPVPAHEEFINQVAVRDLTIDPTAGLAVRIYVPEEVTKDSKNKLAVILHFHGGGYCTTRPDWYMYYHFYSWLVRSAGVICVSVFLRLAPEHRLPVACDDAYAAFLWLCGVAEGKSSEPWLDKYADFGRVFLAGDSTGGNLVHQVAARAGSSDVEVAVRLAGGVAIHPGFLRAEPRKSLLELPDNPLLTREMVNKFMSLALPIGSTLDHPVTSPMGPQAPPLATVNLPPMMILVAEMDLLRDTDFEYCEAMKEAGKDVEVLVNKGMGHCFYFNKMAIDMDQETAAEAERIIQEIKSFINRH